MKNPETFVCKNMHGNWQATSVELIAKDLQLKISTHKVYSGAVVTTATVGKIEGNFVSHVMFQDFSKTLSNSRYGRATAKVVEQQHAEEMKHYASIKTEALAHYSKEVK